MFRVRFFTTSVDCARAIHSPATFSSWQSTPYTVCLSLLPYDGELTELRGRQATLRLPLYADDAALFLNPNKEEVDLVLYVMENFGKATGLKINVAKSLVAAIRCADVNLDAVLSNFTGQRVAFPLSYLGHPLNLGGLRLVHLQPTLDRVKAKACRLARKASVSWRSQRIGPLGTLANAYLPAYCP